MYYRLVSTKNSRLRSTLKIILLIVGVVFDITAIWGLVFVCLGIYIYFLMLFGSIAFSILFRLVALQLVYNVECRLQSGNLVLSKVYPNKTQIVFSKKLGDFTVTPYDKDDFVPTCDNKNVVDLLTSEYEQYVIIDGAKCVLCNLDKYIYASILKGEEI